MNRTREVALGVRTIDNDRRKCSLDNVSLTMGLVNRLVALFSGSEEKRLKQGMDLAKVGKPDAAICIYDAILANSKDNDLRARTLLNRALAYSALSDDGQAERDLRSLLANNQCPELVKTTAREKLARIQKRMLRVTDRSKSKA